MNSEVILSHTFSRLDHSALSLQMAPGEWACEEAGRRDALSKTGLMGL